MKKVNDKSDGSFSLDGSKDEYQMLDNNISRHFNRLNTEGLLLAETSTWYDFVGKNKSEELFKAYANSKLPRSEEKCVESDDTLPNFICVKNGNVLQKRSKPKILAYPKPKNDYSYMYSRCLLFLPLASEEELLRCDLKEKFMELNTDGSGTRIDANERKLFMMKIQKTKKVETEEELEDNSQSGSDDENDPENPLDYLLEALEAEMGEKEDEIEETSQTEPANENEQEILLDYLLEALESV